MPYNNYGQRRSRSRNRMFYNRNQSNSFGPGGQRRNGFRNGSKGPNNNNNTNFNNRYRSRSNSRPNNLYNNRNRSQSWHNNYNNKRRNNNNNNYSRNNNYNNYNNNRPKHNNNNNQNRNNNQNSKNNRRYRNNNSNNQNGNFVLSSNPDFALGVRTCYKLWSAGEQLRNWETTPRSVTKAFENLGQTINPVNPSDAFKRNIGDIMREAAGHINTIMKRHLTDNIDHLYREITRINPLDKDRMIQTVKKQILRSHRNLDHNKLDRDMETIARRFNSIATAPVLTIPRTEQARPITRMDNTTEILASMAQSATPPRVKSPNNNLYSDVVRGGQKRPRTDDTPPATLQQVRLLTPTSVTIPSEGRSIPRTGTKTVHDPTDKEGWKINLRQNTSCVIIADSNSRCIDQNQIPEDTQLEVFPGMRFEHATKILNTLPRTIYLNRIIFSCGINNRSMDYFYDGTYMDMDELEEVLLTTRPEEVHFIGIQKNDNWQPKDRENIGEINQRLSHGFAHSAYIEPLPDQDVDFRRDGHHYTSSTTENIWAKVKELILQKQRQQQQKN